MTPVYANEYQLLISKKKNEPEWMLEWRLKAFHRLKSMKIPTWAKVEFLWVYIK